MKKGEWVVHGEGLGLESISVSTRHPLFYLWLFRVQCVKTFTFLPEGENLWTSYETAVFVFYIVLNVF